MNLSNHRTLQKRTEVPKRTRHQEARLAANLRLLLLGLARYLLKAGITPKFFGELAYGAFVEAAADISRCRNGRVNRSRIAVLTSLRRAEVKHFLSRNVAFAAWRIHQPRTHRVIAAWTADRRYLDSRGLPRRLPLRGGRASFASLVKEFAGDVPPRAVLEELRRLKVVREVSGYMDLLRAGRVSSQAADPSVLELIDILLDGLEAVDQSKPSEPSSHLYRAALSARDAIDLTLMRKRVANGASVFLDGLERSLSTPINSSMGNKKMKRGLTVTVLVRQHSGLPRKGVQR